MKCTYIIQHDREFRTNVETVSTAGGNENAVTPGAIQLDALMMPIGPRTFSKVDDDVEYFALNTGHQLIVVVWRSLKMQAAQNVICGHRIILFGKRCWNSVFRESILLHRFYKAAAAITLCRRP